MSDYGQREAAWIEETIEWKSPRERFYAGWDAAMAAKAEPMQINREALIAVLDGLKEVEMGEDEDASELIVDAVIAHLAAQPVTGTVEWGVRTSAGNVIEPFEEAHARRNVLPHEQLVHRTVTDWEEAD